jgi:hydrogenase maturation protease
MTLTAVKSHSTDAELTLEAFDDADTLIYGVGNLGRQDDGLGWAFIDWLEEQGWCRKAQCERVYQLSLEDADLFSRVQRVLLVDASKDPALESFSLYAAAPRLDFSFTSHALSIEAVMATCQLCFGRTPQVHVLALRGYEWELQLGLTTQARNNLLAATHFLTRSLHMQPG